MFLTVACGRCHDSLSFEAEAEEDAIGSPNNLQTIEHASALKRTWPIFMAEVREVNGKTCPNRHRTHYCCCPWHSCWQVLHHHPRRQACRRPDPPYPFLLNKFHDWTDLCHQDSTQACHLALWTEQKLEDISHMLNILSVIYICFTLTGRAPYRNSFRNVCQVFTLNAINAERRSKLSNSESCLGTKLGL